MIKNRNLVELLGEEFFHAKEYKYEKYPSPRNQRLVDSHFAVTMKKPLTM